MIVLSCFDGISCGQVALERAGIPVTTYFASEIDKHAIKVTQHNYPNTIQLGDIKSVVNMATYGLIGKVDILMGGSPCQGFSTAGKQLGFADPRSQLFYDFLMLKNILKPRWFLLENVKMKQADCDIITGRMGVKPVLINSADFSAQNRKRLYWTNVPVHTWVDAGIRLNDVVENGWCSDRDKSYCIDASYGKKSNWKRYFHRGSRQIVFRHNHIPNPPPIEELCGIGQRIENGNWRMLTPTEAERLQTLPDDYTNVISDSQRYKSIGNGWTVDVIAHILRGIHDYQ